MTTQVPASMISSLPTVQTADLASASVTPAKLSQPLTQGTAVASTSGTSIDFTGIPSWVKRITVMFNGVSTSGTSVVIVQLGTSGGVETSGYAGVSQQGGSAVTYTSGVIVSTSALASSVRYGALVFTSMGSNLWACQGVIADTGNVWSVPSAGTKTLSATLDRLRVTTSNGTDTFDAGSINIIYE